MKKEKRNFSEKITTFLLSTFVVWFPLIIIILDKIGVFTFICFLNEFCWDKIISFFSQPIFVNYKEIWILAVTFQVLLFVILGDCYFQDKMDQNKMQLEEEKKECQ